MARRVAEAYGQKRSPRAEAYVACQSGRQRNRQVLIESIRAEVRQRKRAPPVSET
jgi:hypothetical protein